MYSFELYVLSGKNGEFRILYEEVSNAYIICDGVYCWDVLYICGSGLTVGTV